MSKSMPTKPMMVSIMSQILSQARQYKTLNAKKIRIIDM